MDDLTYLEISRSRLFHNIQALSKRIGDVSKLCAVVKGNAYGHGIEEIVPLLKEGGISKFAVYHPDEAIQVREAAGDSVLVMLLGFLDVSQVARMAAAGIECLLLNRSRLQEIHDHVPNDSILRMHLKMDTGMTRFGLTPDEIEDFAIEIKKLPKLLLTGAATHFANAWNINAPEYAHRQQTIFKNGLDHLTSFNGDFQHIHMNNTAAIFNHPDTTYSFVRSGIGIFGYYPSKEMKEAFDHEMNLKPVLSFKSKIVSLKWMKPGEYDGYDITFQAERKTKIALAPVGYSDGFPFAHSDRGAFVLIHGKRVPLIGRVNMNAIFLDVTDLDKIALGDKVTILGEDGGESVDVWNWMEWGTPHLYESLTKMRYSLPKHIVD